MPLWVPETLHTSCSLLKRRAADPITQAGELAVDAAVAPGGVSVARRTIRARPNEAKFSSFRGSAVISGVFTRKEALAAAQRIAAANDR